MTSFSGKGRSLWRRIAVWTAITLGTILGLTLLIISPSLLQGLSRTFKLDWTLLSNVGQTYGAAATILSALSLFGVTVSLLVQARTMRIAREQAGRALQIEIMRFAMDDPRLLRTVGIPWDGTEEHATRIRQGVYSNMWLSYWRSLYDMGSLQEKELRLNLSEEMFSGEVGREHARRYKSWHEASIRDRIHREFYRIVEDEYHKALRSGTVPVSAIVPKQPSRSTATIWTALALTVGIGIALQNRRQRFRASGNS